jgi:hypothetical protein
MRQRRRAIIALALGANLFLLSSLFYKIGIKKTNWAEIVDNSKIKKPASIIRAGNNSLSFQKTSLPSKEFLRIQLQMIRFRSIGQFYSPRIHTI